MLGQTNAAPQCNAIFLTEIDVYGKLKTIIGGVMPDRVFEVTYFG